MRNKLYLFVVLALVSLMSSPLFAQKRLVVDKNRMSISLISGTDTLARYPISCGRGYGHKQKRGDLRTPEGVFHIVQIQDASQWGHDFGDGNGYIRGAYGPWFIRLSAGSGIGIHGTHDPASMGLRASEGCIRLRNQDLLLLKPLLSRGMEVEIVADTFPLIPMEKLQKRPVQPSNLPFCMTINAYSVNK